jgi:hypothetical protein
MEECVMIAAIRHNEARQLRTRPGGDRDKMERLQPMLEHRYIEEGRNSATGVAQVRLFVTA